MYNVTWVDLLICSHSVSIHNGLEATSELVDLVVGGGLLVSADFVQDGRNI